MWKLSLPLLAALTAVAYVTVAMVVSGGATLAIIPDHRPRTNLWGVALLVIVCMVTAGCVAALTVYCGSRPWNWKKR